MAKSTIYLFSAFVPMTFRYIILINVLVKMSGTEMLAASMYIVFFSCKQTIIIFLIPVSELNSV